MIIRGLICLVSFLAVFAQASEETLTAFTKDMQPLKGFYNCYWDGGSGTLWLEIDRFEVEFLYIVSLPVGVGSNDIGLDRGQVGDRRIVRFQRIGPKILLVQPNYRYRAISENPEEVEAVAQAFAESVVWGFTVAAEEGGSVLVDATDFFLRDAHGVIEQLKRTDQGKFILDKTRSAFFLSRIKNFPYNTEVEVTLTFTGDTPGRYVREVTPNPEAISVRQHHSLVQLPDGEYVPRRFDPRAGYFGIDFMDFAAPISAPVEQRFIARHRLKKRNPRAAMSEPLEPIVYYLDRGAPEPIRSALLEGARWWNQAFESAGYINAFRVEMMPAGADPMDVRYNLIQWVHRATRGWSYGDAIMDPRTGEIIKGHISLGSLRVRQDFLIAEGLLAPYKSDAATPSAMQEMALARLRQLSAHEVGHTLGLMHNFAASVNQRASVMDYPHPYIKIGADNRFDLGEAYAKGIGEWDKISIQYGYSDFPDGADVPAALKAILQKGLQAGLLYVTDSDARPGGGAHPQAHLWDNGTDAAAELRRVLQVRKLALARFSENNIPEDRPMANLEEVLVPLYFFHRYQTEAAAKLVGGLDYSYALRGDGQLVSEIVPPAQSQSAIAVLLETLLPSTLMLPDRILQIIPPRAPGMSRDRETFRIRTGLTFDPLSAAEAAAHHTLRLLLHHERAARMMEYHARDKSSPDFTELVKRLVEQSFRDMKSEALQRSYRWRVAYVTLYHLMHLAANDDASPEVRAVANGWLRKLQDTIGTSGWGETGSAEMDWPQQQFTRDLLTRFFAGSWEIDLPAPLEPPAGSPIGTYPCGW